MNKCILKIFKICLVVTVLGTAMIVFMYASGYFSYTRLVNIAKTLPSYEGVDLASGTKGEESCYFHYDNSVCRALITNIKSGQDSNVEVKKFVNASQGVGIEWSDYDKLTRIDSHVFVRDGRNYQLYIESGKGGNTSVSLLEY